ncbi:phosphotransferase family protein [Rossellomorea vietnamensis]|uniref:phosphotransferase family protein n=1 Tax=Rossellomorea vietnamensis TaxID=218284 RepID=UPI003D2E72DC
MNKELPLYKLPIILYKCLPLMPVNPIKRIKVIASYLLAQSKNKHIEFSLPISGEIVLRIRENNYKVINLKNNNIYTVFNNECEEEIVKNVSYSKNSRMYEEIFEVDLKQKVIRAAFYNGHHPNLTKASYKTRKDLEKMFSNLIMSSKTKTVNAQRYADNLVKSILTTIKNNSSIISNRDCAIVKEFVEEMHLNFLKKSSKESIILTLSHGDIKQDNIIQTREGIILIDWEFGGFRTPTYDYFKFRSRFPHFGKEYFECILELVANELNEKHPQSELSKYFRCFYPKYYYLNLIEDIELRLKQFETRDFAKDINKIIKFIEESQNELLYLRKLSEVKSS